MANLNPLSWITNKLQTSTVENMKVPSKYALAAPNNKFDEVFKGDVEQKIKKWPKILGEEHPFDFKLAEDTYIKFGPMKGVVDKYMALLVNNFYVTSNDGRALEIIEQFIQDTDFHLILKDWVKEGLIKGSGFLELGGDKDEPPQGIKILDAKYMYINRDEKGTLKKYTQYTGAINRLNKKQIQEFEPWEVAHISIDRTGDCPYGYGIVFPALKIIDDLVKSSHDMHALLGRKANTPVVAKVGSLQTVPVDIPSDNDIQAVSNLLTFMNNKTEFAHGPNVELKTIDYGNIGQKFDAANIQDWDMFFFTVQLSEGIMGRGSIPEGLLKQQMEMTMMVISGMQAEIEKVVETQIFRRVLRSQGIDSHVEFEWGQPSNTEKNERLVILQQLLALPFLNNVLREKLEVQVATLLGIDESELESPEEEQENEENEPQPLVPGQNEFLASNSDYHLLALSRTRFKSLAEASVWAETHGFNLDKIESTPAKFIFVHKNVKSFKKGSFRTVKLPDGVEVVIGTKVLSASNPVEVSYEEGFSESTSLKEWIGFNYQEYLEHIEKFISQYEYDDLRAHNSAERYAGKLSQKQVNQVRNILKDSFGQGATMRDIRDRIRNEVKPANLYRTDNGKLVLDSDNRPLLAMSKEFRPGLIARTETIRAAAGGSLLNYKDEGIREVRFVAAASLRTCPICEGLNGRVFGVNEGEGMIPVHPQCRCSFVAITELG